MVALVMVYVAVIGFGVVNRYNWNFNLGLTTLEGFPVAWGIILFSFVCHPYLPGNMIVHEYYEGVLKYSRSPLFRSPKGNEKKSSK